MGPVARLIGSGIGLVSEALAHRKQKKAKAAAASSTTNIDSGSDVPQLQATDSSQRTMQQGDTIEVSDEQGAQLISTGQAVQVGYNEKHDPNDPPPSYEETVNDEADWALDEAADESEDKEALSPNDVSPDEKPDVRKILARFLERHPFNGALDHDRHLPCPVIIPQRRPRTKSRGFVKAYAPVLEIYGIDQLMWMDFIETFRKASDASPIFNGILIAGNAIGFVPSVTAMVASMLIITATKTAIVVQSRSRTNTFLDDINEHFFRPRGLFVLLIKYKGSRNKWSSEPLDISNAVQKSSQVADAPKSGNRAAKFKHNLKYASGTSHGDMEIPSCAPLIYPIIDDAAGEAPIAESINEQEGESTKKENKKPPGTFKKSSKFVNDYLDRRAQATFQSENPTSSSLHAPTPGFASRYSDPTHPASSGSLVALLTGGKLDPKGRRRVRDQKLKAKTGLVTPMGYVREYKPVRRMLQQEVLYMMVVNMPKEEEIEKARMDMEGSGDKVEEGELGEDDP